MSNFKYPRTYHFSFSEGATSDDKVASSDSIFTNKKIVVTEKLDGENTGLSRELCHARSLDSKDHPSRHHIKTLWGQIRYEIPEGFKIFGENVFAKHSIHYRELGSYFYVFAILNEETFLSWEDTKEWANLLGLEIVPELYSGIGSLENIKNCWTGISRLGGEQEGYVVRSIESYPYNNFATNVLKFVRKNHVSTSSHWMQEKITPNIIVPKIS